MDLVSETLPTAPPPPSEVKVRTMRSDLASMAQSGGGLPKFQNVKISGLTLAQRTAVAQGGKNGKYILIAVVFLIVLAVLGFVIYQNFKSAPQELRPAAPTSTQSNPVAIPPAAPPPTAPSSVPILKL